MALRFLAGGNVWDIVDLHKVGTATFKSILWKCVDAINMHYPINFPLNDPQQLSKISEGFHTLNKHSLPGCVGAIDGLAVEIKKPSAWDTLFPTHFMNRKGFFSINCQAMCDSDLRFLWASLKSPGGTHDSLAWRSSDLHGKLDSQGLPDGMFIVGDGAYTCRPWLVTPFPSRGLTRSRSDFNFYQSRTRTTIERAFGVLVAIWGVLRRSLTCSVSTLGCRR
mmetsp:Transcript_26064/g.72977  ORF Transcript_26064/g.72977 Transcript_26064/m.72977 type:complete len:222 (-) Transcript_26064:377-1042(-)